MEANVRPLPDLLVDLAVSYVDFEYTSIAPQAGGPTNPGGVQKGMISPYTPEWKASLGAQYTFGIGRVGSIIPRVDARLSVEGLGHGDQFGSHADRWIHRRQCTAHAG